mgnify:CR=1 FL=1
MTQAINQIAHLDVALLTEGVDRNNLTLYNTEAVKRSPSSRRAWIEMDSRIVPHTACNRSPSSRRAWIEMSPLLYHHQGVFVALLTEGVDRNSLSAPEASGWPRRPPHGGRG